MMREPDKQPKVDCIMFRGNKKSPFCTGLNDVYCMKEGKCSFYKSCLEYNNDGTKKKECGKLG